MPKQPIKTRYRSGKAGIVLSGLATLTLSLSATIASGPMVAQEPRILNFPDSESWGKIYVLPKDWSGQGSSPEYTKEMYIARGPVKVERSKILSLVGSYALAERLGVLKAVQADALARLDLAKLPVQSDDLANMSHLTSLRQLDLDQTDVDDTGLKHLKTLKNLQLLSLSHTLLKGTSLGELASLNKLEELHVGHCALEANKLSGISKLKSLRFLHLGASALPDASIDCLTPLTRLESLNLDGNKALTDSGIKKLKSLKRLHQLYLADTQVSEAGILALLGLQLERLRLTNTKVTVSSKSRLHRVFPQCNIQYTKSSRLPTEIFNPLH